MNEGLELLGNLTGGDHDWLFAQGVERQVIMGTQVILEGAMPDELYFVLRGLLGVRLDAAGERVMVTLGAGEVVGDMSMLEGQTALVTVVAVENTLLLAISRERLQAHVEEDEGFALRFYRAVATANARRLRSTTKLLNDELARGGVAESQHDHEALWRPIGAFLASFKKLFEKADRMALNRGSIPDEVAEEIRSGFATFCRQLNTLIGVEAPTDKAHKLRIGRRLKVELLPYLLSARDAERVYSKPRGYAGDFLTIHQIYENEPVRSGRVGALMDRCFLDLDAAQAVRNRRGLLMQEILDTMDGFGEERTRVLSIACGPAAEVFDVFAQLDDVSRLDATLLDIDIKALAFVGDRAERSRLTKNIRLIQGNLVYLATGKEKLAVEPQHLIYSIGLIDYFNDALVIKLIDYQHQMGENTLNFILGNFHPQNPTRALMDHVLDWKLIHRDEADMHRLFEASTFGKPCTSIKMEPTGVNLFASAVK